jgi:hypothetical protein
MDLYSAGIIADVRENKVINLKKIKRVEYNSTLFEYKSI